MGESQNRVPRGIVLQMVLRPALFGLLKAPPTAMGMVQKLLPLGNASHPPKTAANVFMTGNHGFTQEPGRIWHCPANTSNTNSTPVLQSKTHLGIGEQEEDANDLPEFPVLCLPPQGACLTSASSALTAPWGGAVTITPVDFLSPPLCSASLFWCLGWE